MSLEIRRAPRGAKPVAPAEAEDSDPEAPGAPAWAMGLVSVAVSFGPLVFLTGLAALARPGASNEG